MCEAAANRGSTGRGRVCAEREDGNHQALMAMEGAYATLYNQQVKQGE